MKKFLTAMMILMSLSSGGCVNAKPIDVEPPRNLSTSVDEFCWKYFATLDRNESIFFSPYGIHAALSILANGATGDTRTEILNVLEIDNIENLNDCHKNFSAYVAKNYTSLAESNLLLVDKKIAGRGLDKNFKKIVTDIYKSDAREADFSGNIDGEKKKITRWVADKTKNFIPNYNSIATADTLVDLLNIVYFKDKWAIPFKERNTFEENFKNRDGSLKEVSMMSNIFKESIKYYADEKFKGIELPYTSNAAMYLILPVDDDALNVAELWNEETFSYRADFLNGLKNSYPFDGEVVVHLPKLELESKNNLVKNFMAMGINKAFSDYAEFFNIVKDTSLKINNAQHCAKLKVDEQGTEAAAVTEITMIETTAMPNPRSIERVYFIAERPYLLLIRDIKSSVTLFAGVVNRL